MSDVLMDPRVVKTLEEDLLVLLRVLFVDPLGWTLHMRLLVGINELERLLNAPAKGAGAEQID
jgi:hypothetical protein